MTESLLGNTVDRVPELSAPVRRFTHALLLVSLRGTAPEGYRPFDGPEWTLAM